MSKKHILKYQGAYQDNDVLYQPSSTVSFEDRIAIKTMTVERITFPKGFLIPGEAWIAYQASDGFTYYCSSVQAGVRARRFGDIFHAAYELNRWFAETNSLHADIVTVSVDESKSFIRIKSYYTGMHTPEFSIRKHPNIFDTTNTPAFAKFVSECFKLPYYPDVMSFPVSNNNYNLSWYDPTGGVNEIYMTADLPDFEKEFSTEYDSTELNKTIMSFPVPDIKYESTKELEEGYTHMINDAKLYERKTFKSKDMIAPFSITFSSENYLKSINLYFYADVDGFLTNIFFPTPVYIVMHVLSMEDIEKEENIPRLLI